MKSYKFDAGLGGLSDLIHSEYDPTYTTDKLTLLAGSGAARVLAAFALAAFVALGAPTVSAGAVVSGSGGTPGNGAIGTVTADVGAPAGIYQVRILNPATNAGAFEVIKPDGSVDGNGTVGVAYNGTINFTLADGGTDFVEDDRIPVTVSYAAGSGKVVRWDPAGANGSQTIIGINLFDAEAADGVDDECVVLRRGPVIVRRSAINFHPGATTDHKTAAYAALAALGMKVMTDG